MAAERQAEPHDGLAGLREREVHGLIGRRARVRLHVRVLHAEQALRALDRERLDLIDVFLAFVVALAGIAFGVLVVEDRARRFHDGRGRVVLGRDQPDVLVLAPRLERDQAVDLGVGRAQRGHVGHSHSSKQGLNSAGEPLEGAIVYRTPRRLRSDGAWVGRSQGGSVAGNKLSSLRSHPRRHCGRHRPRPRSCASTSARAPTSPAGRLRRRRAVREAARHAALRRRPERSRSNQIVTDVALAPTNAAGRSRVQGGLLPAEAEGRRPRQRRAAVRGLEPRPQGHSADDEPSGRRASIQARRASSATGSCSSKVSRCCGSAGSSTRRPAIRCCCASIRRRRARRDGARAQRLRRAHAQASATTRSATATTSPTRRRPRERRAHA